MNISADNKSERLLTDREAGEYFGVSRQTVWTYVRKGIIPKPLTFGGITRFPLSDILGVIEAAKHQRAA